MKNSLKTIINGLKTWVIDRLDFNKLKNRPFYEDVEKNIPIVPTGEYNFPIPAWDYKVTDCIQDFVVGDEYRITLFNKRTSSEATINFLDGVYKCVEYEKGPAIIVPTADFNTTEEAKAPSTTASEWVFYTMDKGIYIEDSGYGSYDQVYPFEITIVCVENRIVHPMNKKFMPEHEHSWESLEDKPFYTETATEVREGTENSSDGWVFTDLEFAQLLFENYENAIFTDNDGVCDFVEISDESEIEKIIKVRKHEGTNSYWFISVNLETGRIVFGDNGLGRFMKGSISVVYDKYLKRLDKKFIPEDFMETFVINVSQDENGAFTSDKTHDEILTAYGSQKTMMCVYGEKIYHSYGYRAAMDNLNFFFIHLPIETTWSDNRKPYTLEVLWYSTQIGSSNGEWYYKEIELASETFVNEIVDEAIANLPTGGGSNEKKLIVEYVHSGNQELYIESIDYTTGVITFTEPHGLTTNSLAFMVPNVDYKTLSKSNLSYKYLCAPPYEYRKNNDRRLYPIDEYTATFGNITSIDSASSMNTLLDHTLWHFEISVGFSVENIHLLKKLKHARVIFDGWFGYQNNYLYSKFIDIETNKVVNPMYLNHVLDIPSNTFNPQPLYRYLNCYFSVDKGFIKQWYGLMYTSMPHGTTGKHESSGMYYDNNKRSIGYGARIEKFDDTTNLYFDSFYCGANYFHIANGTVAQVYEYDGEVF